MDINIGTFSGTVDKVAELTSQSGNGYLSIDVMTMEFSQGQQAPAFYPFLFFREQAQTYAKVVQKGDYVLVTYKLKHNSKGYVDMMAQSLQVIRKGEQAPQQAPQPQAYQPAPATPYQQIAQRAQQAAYGVPQQNTDEMF